ncbi:MAG TPA: hypothetical protein VK824_11340, partial [Planctomycetota bacterium]|nr:hypothetical protein [Planctomycetota bacterium]
MNVHALRNSSIPARTSRNDRGGPCGLAHGLSLACASLLGAALLAGTAAAQQAAATPAPQAAPAAAAHDAVPEPK